MKLIVGLGNPGKTYEQTRHNAGFWTVDHLAKQSGQNWKTDARRFAEIVKTDLDGERIVLAKPQTFMNESGKAVQALMQFFKILADDVLIIHDDLDLPAGGFSFSQGGRSAGHRGVDSIYKQTGSRMNRLRIGIGRPEKAKQDVKDWVLEKPSAAETRIFKKNLIDLGAAAEDWAMHGGAYAMDAWNHRKKGN